MGAVFERLYAVADHVYIPLIKAGTINQAVGADWTPVAGDVKISIDGGAAANVTNLPTAIAMGNGAIWDFSLTSGEQTGKKMLINIADAVTKAVQDDAFIIETFGDPAAQRPFNLAAATAAANVTQFGGVAGTFAAGIPAVNATQVSGAAPETGAQVATLTRDQAIAGAAGGSWGALNQTMANAIAAFLDVAVSSRASPADVSAAVAAAIGNASPDIAFAVWSQPLDQVFTAAAYLIAAQAGASGKLTKTGGTTWVFQNMAQTFDVVSVTVNNVTGERIAVTYNPHFP